MTCVFRAVNASKYPLARLGMRRERRGRERRGRGGRKGRGRSDPQVKILATAL